MFARLEVLCRLLFVIVCSPDRWSEMLSVRCANCERHLPTKLSTYQSIDLTCIINLHCKSEQTAGHALTISHRMCPLPQLPKFAPTAPPQKKSNMPHWLITQSLNSSQPANLCSLLSYHIPARSLRSSNTNLLPVPRVRTIFASRFFSPDFGPAYIIPPWSNLGCRSPKQPEDHRTWPVSINTLSKIT